MSDLYTLTGEGYWRDKIIEEYQALVWTERYIEAGELRLVIPATPQRFDLLEPGTLLGLNGSREVMLIDTREHAEGMLTVSGSTIEAYFAERYIDEMILTDQQPHDILGMIVQNMIDRAETTMAAVAPTYIPRLAVGTLVGHPHAVGVDETIAAGPAYPELLRIAQKYNLDIHVYLVSSALGGSELHFVTNAGKDRTSDQTTNKLVRFSPSLDNFANVTELRSDKGFKSAVVAIPPTDLSVTVDPVKISKVPNGDAVYQPFKERILEITPEIVEADLASGEIAEEKRLILTDLLTRAATRRLRQEARTDVIDGEATPNSQYKFSEDTPSAYYTWYDLGDKVEVGGYFGNIRTGYMTEYIRAYDGTGIRGYPSIKQVSEYQGDAEIIT